MLAAQRLRAPLLLLYAFNDADDVLLLERAQEPNRGFWNKVVDVVSIQTL